jgi:hypothetical protein
MSKIKPIAIIQSMSGKVCEHSGMYFRTNKRTNQVCTGKICNPSDADPSEAQLRVQSRFAKISAAVDALLAEPAERQKWQERYLGQHKIGSLKGYVFAKINHQYDENGDKIEQN